MKTIISLAIMKTVHKDDWPGRFLIDLIKLVSSKSAEDPQTGFKSGDPAGAKLKLHCTESI